IHTTLLFDSFTKTFCRDKTLLVNPHTGLIEDVYTRTSPPQPTSLQSPNLDLRGKTVVPGLVDAHTRIFLHEYATTSSINQERDESIVERIIRATLNCKRGLRVGDTTYRDLGTEGAFSADVGWRDAVNRGLIPGPRLFVATEALASSGGYEIRQENALGGTTVPRLSDVCDGVDGCTAAVRRRTGAGADVVKFYADYRRRTLRWPLQNWRGCFPVLHLPSGLELKGGLDRNPVSLLFRQEEMDAMVAEAKRARAPIAAHAIEAEAVIMAAKAGVTTVEHGMYASEEALQAMKECGTIFVPTVAIIGEELFWTMVKNTKRAFDLGVKLACGGDTGAFPHGENAREMKLMVEVSIPVEEVLRAGTLGGWEVCGGELSGHRFGWLGEGWSADLVALDGDLDKEDFASVIRKVSFVMKDGQAVVVEGK
ncbi:hypothetical protein BDV97DRAFT_267369, partial [Delphinella strobiligena]